MKKLEIYSAYEGREDVEGRCTWKLIANFTNPEDAEKAAKGKYRVMDHAEMVRFSQPA